MCHVLCCYAMLSGRRWEPAPGLKSPGQTARWAKDNTHVYVYMYMHVYMYTHICIYVYIYIYIYMRIS